MEFKMFKLVTKINFNVKEAEEKIWMELSPEGSHEDCERRAALANRMLKRLGVDYHDEIFWWSRAAGCYCVRIDAAGGYLKCEDNGHWFNLRSLAGEQS